jgi:hypothetical protein
MENGKQENIFENAAKLGQTFFNVESAKKIAGLYIDTGEKLANDILDFQATATGWAKETPLAPILQAQADFARKLVKQSAEVARNLCQSN